MFKHRRALLFETERGIIEKLKLIMNIYYE